MRNKITKLFSIVIAVLACASCFVDPNSPSHNEHIYGEWIIEREASCIDEGIERRYCECGVSEERFTGFTEHNYREDFVQEGSCNQVGFIRYSCDRCGDSYHKDTGMGQHVYTTLEIVNPSCQQDGYIRYICHGCGSTFDDVLKPEECTFTLKEKYEGTCMEEGYLMYVCDNNPDHTYIEYTGEYGEHQYNVWQYGDCHIFDSCYVCYQPHPQQGQNVPHEFTDWNIDYEASCFSNGLKSKSCKDCNYYYSENIDPTHIFEKGICVMCQDHEPTDGLIYQKINDYEYAVVGINQQTVDRLVIPNVYKGLYVTEIKTNAFNGKTISSIVLPKSMKIFRNNAFYGITGLTNVYYSATLSDWFKIDFAYTDSNNIYSTPAAKGVTIHFLDENNEYYAPANLVIPNDVTRINRFKFANFEQLTNVTFHDNIEYIAIGAFYNCDNLENITINAKEIDNMAFGDCDNLNTVSICEGIKKLPAGMFIYNEALIDVSLPESLEEIAESVFMGCTSLTHIEIPNSVRILGAGLFYNCSSLENVLLPDSLQNIDGYMFYGCSNLNYNEIDGAFYLGSKNNPKLMLINYTNAEVVTYTVDSAVKFIEQEAINGCDNLVELIIPETVLDYVPHIIRNCPVLTRLTLPYYGLGSIGNVFYWDRYNLEYLCINGGEISNRDAIKDYPYLKEIYISDNVEKFEFIYFSNLPKLEKLTVPYFDSTYVGSLDAIIDESINLKYLNILNAEHISVDFLQNHHELEEVYLPDSLRIVNDYIYDIDMDLNYNEYENGLYLGSKNNPYLLLVRMIDDEEESFVVHPNVQAVLSNGNFTCTEIDGIWYLGTDDNPYKYVYFSDSYSVDSCEILEGAEIILSSNHTNLSDFNTLILPSTIKEIRCSFSGDFQNYNQVLYYNGSLIDWNNIKFYNATNNPMYRYDEMYYKPDGDEYVKLENLIIPEEIISINDYQYVGFDVSSIKLHNNIENIGKYAFAYSKFDSIDFGQALDTIYDYMFYGATTGSITIPNTITVIGQGAFEQTNISSIELPESIIKIENQAFRESKLTMLQMYPVSYIGEYAFHGTNIYQLYFNGTIYDWLNNNFAYETSTPMNPVTILYLHSLQDGQMIPFNGELMLDNTDIRLIGSYQFKNFTNLYYVLLPDTLEEIGQGAFMNTGISYLNIPYNVTRINDYAFANTNLSSLILSENLTFIGFGIIQNTPVGSIEIPYLGESPTGEAKYQNIAYLYGHLDYNDYRANYSSLYSVKVLGGTLGAGAFYNCSNMHELEIPEISVIPAYAFYNCARLSDLDFGDELTTIERNAFENTSIYRLILPKKINYLGENAFLNSYVTEIYYEDLLSNWSRISTYNMYSTPVGENSVIYSLVDGEFKQDNIIIVPEDVKTLHPYIFSNFDNVDEIHILSNVTYINEGIIYGCDMIKKLVIPFIGSEMSEYAIHNTIEHLVKTSWINNIEEIELLEGTKILQPYSFAHIYSLKKFTLPRSITTIYNYAFNNSPIEEFVYNGTLDDWNKVILDSYDSNPAHNGANVYMYNNNELELLEDIHVVNEGVYIEKFQYAGFNSVKDVHIYNNILVVCEDAFINCEGIENVYYNSSLENWLKIYHTTLKSNPNYYSENFYILENSEYTKPTEATIPEADNNYIYFELVGISSITKVTIPNSKKYIYVDAFSGCDGIEEIYYQGNLEEYLAITSYGYIDHPYTLYVYDDLGGYTTLTNIVMGEYDPVMSYQFTSIKTLETITIDMEYFEMPQHFVAHCENLKNVIIPTNTRFDNYKPFIGCVNLEGNRYNGCIYIGNDENPYLILVGTYDKEMTELIIHDDTKGIVSDALYGCENIKIVSTPININHDNFTCDRDYVVDIDTIIYRGNEDLMRCGLSPNKVVFENGILSANQYSGPLSEGTIEEVIFVNANYVNDITRGSWIYKEYMNAYGNGYYLGNEENPYMVLCYVDTDASNVTIHEDTEVIASYAFSNCYSLLEITIPDSVKYISNYAFVNCNSLSSVKFNSIKGIGVAAFSGTNIRYIVIPETAELIQFTAFDSNVIIYIEGYTLPSNLEESYNSIYLKNEWAYDSNGIPYVIN